MERSGASPWPSSSPGLLPVPALHPLEGASALLLQGHPHPLAQGWNVLRLFHILFCLGLFKNIFSKSGLSSLQTSLAFVTSFDSIFNLERPHPSRK